MVRDLMIETGVLNTKIEFENMLIFVSLTVLPSKQHGIMNLEVVKQIRRATWIEGSS